MNRHKSKKALFSSIVIVSLLLSLSSCGKKESTETAATTETATVTAAAATPVKEEAAPAAPAKEEVAPAAPAKEEVAPAAPAKEEMAPAAPAKEEMAPAAPAKEEMAPAAPAKEEMTPAAPAKEEVASTTPAKEEMTPAAPAKEEVASTTPAKEEMAPAEVATPATLDPSLFGIENRDSKLYVMNALASNAEITAETGTETSYTYTLSDGTTATINADGSAEVALPNNVMLTVDGTGKNFTTSFGKTLLTSAPITKFALVEDGYKFGFDAGITIIDTPTMVDASFGYLDVNATAQGMITSFANQPIEVAPIANAAYTKTGFTLFYQDGNTIDANWDNTYAYTLSNGNSLAITADSVVVANADTTATLAGMLSNATIDAHNLITLSTANDSVVIDMMGNIQPAVAPVEEAPVVVAAAPEKEMAPAMTETPEEAPVAMTETPEEAPAAMVETPEEAPVAMVETPEEAPVAMTETPEEAPVEETMIASSPVTELVAPETETPWTVSAAIGGDFYTQNDAADETTAAFNAEANVNYMFDKGYGAGLTLGYSYGNSFTDEEKDSARLDIKYNINKTLQIEEDLNAYIQASAGYSFGFDDDNTGAFIAGVEAGLTMDMGNNMDLIVALGDTLYFYDDLGNSVYGKIGVGYNF